MKRLGKKSRLLILAVLSMLLIVSGCSQNKEAASQETKTLRLGAIPAEDAEKVKSEYAPLVSYLEKKTGMKVELFVATDYSGVIEAMRSKKLDAAYFGPFSYVLAADKANAEAVVVEKAKGTTTYKSVIIVPADSPIKTLDDIKGHTFAFVDPSSTSGNLIPRFMFSKNNINPDQDFKSVTYAGGHDAVALAVKNKKVEAGATNDLNLAKMVKEGVINANDYRVIMESDPIPGSPWAFRKDLSDDLKKTIETAFLNMATEAPEALNSSSGKLDGYEAAQDKDYDVIREAAKVLNLDLSKLE